MHHVHDLVHHLIVEHEARIGDAVRQAPHLAELRLSGTAGHVGRPAVASLVRQRRRLRRPPPSFV